MKSLIVGKKVKKRTYADEILDARIDAKIAKAEREIHPKRRRKPKR